MIYPEIGKLYIAFDEEHTIASKMYSVRVVSITTIDKIDEYFRKLLLEQKEESADFFIQDSNEVVIGFINDNYDETTLYFIPTLKGKWWGTSISEHIRPVLDLDGELFKEFTKKVAFDTPLWYPQDDE